MRWWLHGLLLVGGLILVEATAVCGWGFVPRKGELETIAQLSISLGSIAIGVVGLLLTLFVTQDLAKKSEANVFRVLIVTLSAASVVALASGMGALSSGHDGDQQSLAEASLYGLVAASYASSFALVLAALEILFVKQSR